MYARLVTTHLKPGTFDLATRKFEEKIIPALKLQKGFRDEVSFFDKEKNESLAISFWDAEADLRKYEKDGYPVMVKVLGDTIVGTRVVRAIPQAQSTSTPLPQPTPTFDLKRLDQPVDTGDNSEQLKKGSILYWGVCLTCRGDRGQGMTEEWRDAYGEDENCWQAGCHGPDHPTPGFEIPEDLVIPPVAGPGKLARIKNAQELHDYILASMPWWNPGDLTNEEAWQVSSYILRMHKVMPTEFELADTNGSAITTQYAVPQPGDDRPAILTITAVLGLAAIGLLLQDVRREKPIVVERPNFFHHLHPPTIPSLQARLRYTLGAGGLAVLLCLILFVTGILEMFYYILVPTHAAISVETITSLVPFGALTRNLHYWSAQALMIVMTIHLLRVVLRGADAARGEARPLTPGTIPSASSPARASSVRGSPSASGAALAMKLQKKDSGALHFFGDGASNRGDFHESLNIAGVMKLPVVYVCDNNCYAISVPQTCAMAITDIAIRASSYGFPGVVVDGNDVLAVYEATQQAITRARKGEGPTLIECKTYRWMGHSTERPGSLSPF